MFGTSALNVLGGSSFSGNAASGGVGGAIAATNAADINVNNATFQHNSSSSHGGAIYLDAGTLDATGWWDFRFNAASGNGGAVAIAGR
jgi:predicted outer membrane repeat protein